MTRSRSQRSCCRRRKGCRAIARSGTSVVRGGRDWNPQSLDRQARVALALLPPPGAGHALPASCESANRAPLPHEPASRHGTARATPGPCPASAGTPLPCQGAGGSRASPSQLSTARPSLSSARRLCSKRGAACWYRPAAGRAQSRKGRTKKNPSAREGSSDGQWLAFSSQPPTGRPTPRDKASRYGVLEAETATRNPV
jgi:hypothetical protein